MTTPITIDADLKIFVGGVLGESSLANNYQEMAAIAEVLIRQKKARGRTTWADFVSKEKTFAFAFSDGTPRYALVMASKDADFFGTEPIPTQAVTQPATNPFAVSNILGFPKENATSAQWNMLAEQGMQADAVAQKPVAIAYKAATDARAGLTKYSQGAYYWDGYDFKTNAKHFKRRAGFKYGKPSHDIFGVPEEKKTYEKFTVVTEAGKKVKKLAGSADSVYVSVAAIEGQYTKSSTVTTKDAKGKKTSKTVKKTIKTGTIFWINNPDYVKHFNGGKDYI